MLLASRPPAGLPTYIISSPHRPIQSHSTTTMIRRQWYLRGVACGADASWGVLGVAMRELQVAQTDLEGPQWIALDAAVQQR